MNFFNGELEQNADGSWSFHEGTFSLDLPRSWQLQITNRQVIFGIRPEDVNSGSNGVQIKASIEAVEPMGSETYLYLNTGNNSFIARVGAHYSGKVGNTVELSFNLEKSHLFDAATEQVIPR